MNELSAQPCFVSIVLARLYDGSWTDEPCGVSAISTWQHHACKRVLTHHGRPQHRGVDAPPQTAHSALLHNLRQRIQRALVVVLRADGEGRREGLYPRLDQEEGRASGGCV